MAFQASSCWQHDTNRMIDEMGHLICMDVVLASPKVVAYEWFCWSAQVRS